LIDLYRTIRKENINSYFTDENSSIMSYIITQNQKYILSYLKLNNFGDIEKYNDKRFSITTDSNANYIQIKYNTDNKKYDMTSEGDWADGGTPEYKDNNVYGRFDKIYKLKSEFGVKPTNKEIAQNMIEILRNILLGKLLFIIGYGASGSGKTSTLIYLNDENNNVKEDGILVHLCKMLGQGGQFYIVENGQGTQVTYPEYTKLTIYTKEFFVSDVVGNCDTFQKSDNCETQEFNFKYTDGNFVCENEQPIPIKFKYKTDKTEFQLKDKKLGEVLVHVIDTDRFVKSTTNNISSSRSHSLIYVVMEQPGDENQDYAHNAKKKIQFVIGDLAGVENTFNCEDKDVLKNLMNIGSKTTNGKLESNYVPFNPSEKSVEPNGFEYDLDTVNRMFGDGFNFDKVEAPTLEKLQTLIRGITKNGQTEVNGYNQLVNNGKKSFDSFEQASKKITEIINELKGIEAGGINDMKKFTEIINLLDVKNLYVDSSKINFTEVEYEGTFIPTGKSKATTRKYKKTAVKYNNENITEILKSLVLVGEIEQNLIKDFCDNTACLASMLSNNKIYPSDITAKFSKLLTNVKLPSSCVSKQGGAKKSRRKKLQNKRQTRRTKQSGGGNKNVQSFNTSVMQKVRDYAQKICNSRVVEGKYINQTLAELRNHITKIMIHKTKDCIFYSPPFHSDCFQYYCPTGANCFSFEQTNNNDSVLINWIHEQYKKTQNQSDINKFYDDIIVSMFCVMNLSRTANNPPPIPYINIKELKKKWAICVNTIYSDNEDTIVKDYKSISGSSIDVDTQTQDQNQSILKKLDKLLESYTPSQVSEIVIQRERMAYFDTPKEILKDGKIYGKYKTEIDNFIKLVENHNAVTAMGTVDYADSFNKLNTPVTNCIIEDAIFESKLTEPQVLQVKTNR